MLKSAALYTAIDDWEGIVSQIGVVTAPQTGQVIGTVQKERQIRGLKGIGDDSCVMVLWTPISVRQTSVI